MESGFKKRNPVKTFPMKDEIGVFEQQELHTPKLNNLQTKKAASP